MAFLWQGGVSGRGIAARTGRASLERSRESEPSIANNLTYGQRERERKCSPQSTAQWFVLPVICRIAWVRVLGLMLSKGYHLNGKVVRIPMVFGVFVMTIFQKLG